MHINEILNIMNSDMKLWEAAEKVDTGTAVTLTLDLPWGIGKKEVTMEGITDAKTRNAALTGYGEYIRGVIHEAIDDENIESRAAQKAAKTQQLDSEVSPIRDSRGLPIEGSTAPPPQEAAPAHTAHAEGPADLGAMLAARRTEVEDGIRRAEDTSAKLKAELAMIEAALGAAKEGGA